MSRRHTHAAVQGFADDLRTFSGQLQDGVNFLKRTVDNKPCSGPREFREALADLDQEITELTEDMEVLEKFTLHTVSFEELLGHCQSLYHANRVAIQQLEAHLKQYGYQEPVGVPREPEDPLENMPAVNVADNQSHGAGASGEEHLAMHGATCTVACASSAPKALNLSKGPSFHGVESPRHTKARIARVATPAAPKGGRSSSDDEGSVDSEDELPAVKHPAACRDLAGGTGFKAGLPAASSRKIPRPSMDSHASSTPEMALTPNTKALLARYADHSNEHIPLSKSPSEAGLTPVTDTPGTDLNATIKGGVVPNAQPKSQPPAAMLRQPAQPAAEEDTCALYHELIRSKDVPSSLQGPPRKAVPPVPALRLHDVPRETEEEWASEDDFMPSTKAAAPTAAAGAADDAAAKARPTTPLRQGLWKDNDHHLANKLASLETLWVQSGQAALTPSRARSALPMRSPGPAPAAQQQMVSPKLGGNRGFAAARPAWPAPAAQTAGTSVGGGAFDLSTAAAAAVNWLASPIAAVAEGSNALSPRQPAAASVAASAVACGGRSRLPATPGRAATSVVVGASAPNLAGVSGTSSKIGKPAGTAGGAARAAATATPERSTRSSLAVTPGRAKPRPTSGTPSKSATPGRLGRSTSAALPVNNRYPMPPSPECPERSAAGSGRSGLPVAPGAGGVDRLVLPERRSQAEAVVEVLPVAPRNTSLPLALNISVSSVDSLFIRGSQTGSDLFTLAMPPTAAAAAAAAAAASADMPLRAMAAQQPQPDLGAAALASMNMASAGGPSSLSPTTSQLLSRALGKDFVGQLRSAQPAPSAALSALPKPLAGASALPMAPATRPKSPAIATWAPAASGMRPMSPALGSIRPKSPAPASMRPKSPAPAAMRPKSPAPAATRPKSPAPAMRPKSPAPAGLRPKSPAPVSATKRSSSALPQPPGSSPARGSAAQAALCVKPCTEEEWSSLPPHTQRNMPLDTLNKHMQALVLALVHRPSGGATGGFCIADVEALGLTTTASKLLLNALVKLRRCEVYNVLDNPNGMLYRLKQH